MKKVLVTGGTGFIGRHTIPLLLQKGYEVHLISSKSAFLLNGVHVHGLNLFHAEQTRQLIETIQPSHLLHFAWVVTPGKFWTSIDNLAWVEASLHLVRSFIASGGKRLVVAGSCTEYDWTNSVCTEGGIFRPATLYGVCKRSLFQILEPFAKQMEISFAWGYIFFLFGPGEYSARFVPSIIRGLLLNQEIPCSHGNQVRDFSDVRDVADAFVQLLDSELTGGINIASGSLLSLKQLAQKISDQLNRSDSINYGALTAPADEPLELMANVDRLTHELGWRPKFSLDDSIKESIQWWKNNLSLQQ